MTLRGTSALLALSMLAGTAAVARGAGDGALQAIQKETRALARSAAPAVVKIKVAEKVVPGGPSVALPGSRRVGSGFLVSAKGIVLTSYRLTRGARTVEVDFSNGSKRQGTVLGDDSFFQVAVLRVAPVKGVRPLKLAAGPPPPAGSISLLMGKAFGFPGSLSLGLVAGSGWLGPPSDPYDNYCVVDSAFRPGEAGGPLLDADGKVLGMAVAVPSGPFRTLSGLPSGRIRFLPRPSGMAFAVPAEDLSFALSEIEAHGRVRQGRLGVRLERESLRIRDVRPKTPAMRAGLKAGDVIVGVDGRAIHGLRDLTFVLRRIPVGKKVSIRVKRGDRQVEVSTKLEEIEPLGSELLAHVDAKVSGKDLVVTRVSGICAASGLGLHVGDLVHTVNGQRVRTVEELDRALACVRTPTSLRVVVERDGKPVKLSLSRH